MGRLGETLQRCGPKPAHVFGLARVEEIAEPAHGLDDVDAELLAKPADEHLDGVGIPVEILIVEMLGQLAARDDAARMVHEIGQQPVLVRGELHRVAVHRHAAGAGVELHRPAGDLARGMAGGAAQQGAHAGEQLLHVEGLRYVIVGAGIEALDLVAPAVAGGQDDDRRLAALAAPGGRGRETPSTFGRPRSRMMAS